MLKLAQSCGPCLAVAAVPWGESLVSSGDTAPTVPARVPTGLPVSGAATDSSATVAEVPEWEEIVEGLEFGECAAYWRRASGEYTLAMVEIDFSEYALSGPETAVQEKLFLRPIKGTEEDELGPKSDLRVPLLRGGPAELLEALEAIFPDESDPNGAGASATVVPTAPALGGVQSDDEPTPCYKLPPDAEVDYWCPHLTARVRRDDCDLGFDWRQRGKRRRQHAAPAPNCFWGSFDLMMEAIIWHLSNTAPITNSRSQLTSGAKHEPTDWTYAGCSAGGRGGAASRVQPRRAERLGPRRCSETAWRLLRANPVQGT